MCWPLPEGKEPGSSFCNHSLALPLFFIRRWDFFSLPFHTGILQQMNLIYCDHFIFCFLLAVNFAPFYTCNSFLKLMGLEHGGPCPPNIWLSLYLLFAHYCSLRDPFHKIKGLFLLFRCELRHFLAGFDWPDPGGDAGFRQGSRGLRTRLGQQETSHETHPKTLMRLRFERSFIFFP